MAYQPLPIITVPLDQLLLDLDNYRIPSRRDDEAAALNYLFTEENAIGSAKEILRDGYFDNEVPIVMKAAGGYTVLEGNRRVSALKAMADPTLVPAHEAEVRRLLNRYQTEVAELPSEIRVIVAADRASAARHIARLHTGLSKKGWSVDQQANYYYSLLGPGTTVDDVKREHAGVTVTRYMKMAVMRRLLAGAKFTDKSLHDYVTGPSLTMSAFEYAFSKKDIAEAIGANFTKSGLLEPESMTPEKIGANLGPLQLRAMEYLISEFRAGGLNTRSLEFRKDTFQHDSLVARLLGDPGTNTGAPHPSAPLSNAGNESVAGGDPDHNYGSGEGKAGDHDAGATSDGGGAAPSGDVQPQGGQSRGPNHPDTKDSLVLTGLDYETHTSVTLQSRYIELRRMKLSQTPAAAAMLLRTILETTIKFHFEGTATPATGELSAAASVLDAAYGNVKALKYPIGQIRSGNATVVGSIIWFNLVCHSADIDVTPAQVRTAFALVHPVLRRLLRPATDAGA